MITTRFSKGDIAIALHNHQVGHDMVLKGNPYHVNAVTDDNRIEVQGFHNILWPSEVFVKGEYERLPEAGK